MLLSSAVFAVNQNTATLENVVVDGIKIVIDGKEFTCTDANGAVVKPMRYKGTTYIPVRAVSTAFGKAVYWDGEEETVYLGKMDGKLKEPTATLEDFKNIGSKEGFESQKNVFDNYDGYYPNAYKSYNFWYSSEYFECLLDKKYSKFKATLFLPTGSTATNQVIRIVGDDEIIYTSDVMDKTSKPIDIDLDITNVNDFKILFNKGQKVYIANAGFYQ